MKAVFEALDRRLNADSPTPVVVALSGGGDSLALLHLAKGWAERHGRTVLALTVDHGMNPDSARWTTEAGERARTLGAAWRGLAWRGDKPATGIQAKARAARHALLAQAAREAGARVILMGHTADDVAEGELMRATDAPGLGRLREWSPSPVWPQGRGVFLLRPLLGVRRAELRAYLAAKDAVWLEDPANEDRRFARIRARELLNTSPPFPFEAERSEYSPAEGRALAVAFDADGATAPQSLPAHALAALLLCVSGTTRPPRGSALERLRTVIATGGVATLCGCRIETQGGTLRVTRAPPRRGWPPCAPEPTTWVAQRFHAACGLYPDEASIPPPD